MVSRFFRRPPPELSTAARRPVTLNAKRRWLMLAAPALLLPVAGVEARAQAEAESDLTGTYDVDGYTAQGSRYSGEAQITRQGAVYRMTWSLTSGESYAGIALGSARSFAATFEGGGLVLYERADDGRLMGIWTGGEGESIGSEQLIPQAD